jgi:hypothetical protein
MRTIPIFIAVLVLTVAVGAQQVPPANPATSQEDISGMYSFLHEGEFVQVTVEDGNYVTGFVSRCDDDGCKAGFIDHFFKSGSLAADNLAFETKKIHGLWFEFNGKVARGEGKTPANEGYRVLRGTLIRHKTDAQGKESAESRQVEFKSFPQDEQ